MEQRGARSLRWLPGWPFMNEVCFMPSTRSAERSAHAARQALWLALVLVLPGGAQNPAPGGQQPISREHLPSSMAQSDDVDPVQEERRLRMLNAERQKSMVADTNKLLKLASELNAEVSSSNRDSLTPDELRKVGEIEKLAHSVKEKMSTSVRGTPMYMEPSLQQLRYPQSLPLF